MSDPEWVRIQSNTFKNWVNTRLRRRNLRIDHFHPDLSDGVKLINLAEILTGGTMPKHTKAPKMRSHDKMALKALVPIGIMAGATSLMGYYTGQSGKQRQYVEHSHDWETALKRIAGVIPPRTRIDPFVAKPHPALEGREIPIYATGALQSQIIPGGPLDPYSNPRPTKEAVEKERQRLKAIKGGAKIIAQVEEQQKAQKSGVVEPQKPTLASRALAVVNVFRPSDPAFSQEPLRLRDDSEVGTLESWEEYRKEQMLNKYREVYRHAPLAEMFRIIEFQKLHPELKVDGERFKKIDPVRKMGQY